MILAALGAATFVDLGGRAAGPGGWVGAAPFVAVAAGLLGAAIILADAVRSRGLNAALTLWASAAAGALAGAHLFAEAIALAVAAASVNALPRPVVDYLDRRPVDPEFGEAIYQLHVTSALADVGAARALVAAELGKAQCPIETLRSRVEGADQMQLTAVLLVTRANAGTLDGVRHSLAAQPQIRGAVWTVSATP